MNEEQIREIFNEVTNRVSQVVQADLNRLTQRISQLEIPRQVREYQPITINENVRCEESLDIVKSLPEFNGDEARYVSWRQAAFAAYKLFEPHVGSSRHYQAVAIIRNKITGRADATLASFNTVLNFEAIMARLDFSFADKRPVHLVEQELSTLRQGSSSINKFYEDVEKKLTLIINKVMMTNEGNASLVNSLTEKYRDDALRVFISGLNKPLCDILFSSKPDNLPSALALARELSSNNARYAFANSFNNNRPIRNNYNPAQNAPNSANFNRNQVAVPMDVDPSTSRFVQPRGNVAHNGVNFSNSRFNQNRPSFQRQSAQHVPVRQQQNNHIREDECNFLGENRSYHM